MPYLVLIVKKICRCEATTVEETISWFDKDLSEFDIHISDDEHRQLTDDDDADEDGVENGNIINL